MNKIIFAAGCLTSGLVGLFIGRKFSYKNVKSYGNLRIDWTDPEKPMVYLEFSKDPMELKKESLINVKVINKSYME